MDIQANRVVLTEHADQRMRERRITWFEVREVLNNGYNERRKDQFKDDFECWTYAIRYDLLVSDSKKAEAKNPSSLR